MPLSLAEVLEEEYRALYPDDADGPHALTWELTVGQIADPRALIETLHVRWPPLAAELWSELTPATQAAVAACYDAGAAPDASLLGALVEELNAIALRPQPTGGVRRLYDARKYQFLETPLSSDLRRLGAMKLEGDDAIHFNRLLLEETFRPEVTRPGAIRPIHEVRLAEVYAAVHERAAQGRPRTALCLSGGGIRSATYALGVVQGLAKKGVLGSFEYLSTVSGGGYIGAWLTAWIHRHREGLPGVLEELSEGPDSPIAPEPAPLRHLRTYSNYLTPRVGVLTADTWTLLATIVRNLVLNWMVLVPLMIAALAAPRLAVAALFWTHAPGPMVAGVYALSLVFGAFAIGYIGLHIPWTPPERTMDGAGRSATPDRPPERTARAGEIAYLLRSWLPFLLSTALLVLSWAWYRNNAALDGSLSDRWLTALFIAYGLALHAPSWVIYAFRSGKVKEWRRALWKLWLPIVLLAAALAASALAWQVVKALFPEPKENPGAYATSALPLMLLLFFAGETVYTGIAGRDIDDEAREWWARALGWVLIAGVVWCVLSALVIFGPNLLVSFLPLVGGMGVLAGVATNVLGRSPKTPATKEQEARMQAQGKVAPSLSRYALMVAAPAFAAFLVIVLSLATDWLLLASARIGWVGDYVNFTNLPSPEERLEAAQGVRSLLTSTAVHDGVIRNAPFLLVLALALLAAGLGSAMAGVVEVNRFSMHGPYRDRLIRAYLGATNWRRRPNPFTDFDQQDNLYMHALGREDPGASAPRLFHVICMTLNLVGGDNLAWQERKAESFTVSRQHCGAAQLGSHQLGYRRTADGPPDKPRYYGGRKGISLGTATTISGAAASPNMGYHSSTFVGLLMAFFNARLGWWLGNPGVAGSDTYQRSFPNYAVGPLVDEAFGRTNDRNRYVFLSDGGHFENLGLYEMVLRRCKYIVVSDASEDPDYAFENLANAVRKVRIDLGVPIDVHGELTIFPRETREGGKYCAVCTIRYSEVDWDPAVCEREHPGRARTEPDHERKCREAMDGTLVMIKTVILGAEPVDVGYYHKADKAFPHQSFGDQMYSESQFESYRVLGQHAMDTICTRLRKEDPDVTDVPSFTNQASIYIRGLAQSPNGAASAPAPDTPALVGQATGVGHGPDGPREYADADEPPPDDRQV